MKTRVMSVGVATLLIGGMKFIGDLEVMDKISIPAILIASIGAIIILATRKGVEEEIEKDIKRSTTYHDANYPSFLK